MSKGLFNKAITQSGLSTMPWGILPDPAAQARRFALQNNCPTVNTKEMVKCLKSKKASDLVEIHKETTDSLRPMISLYLPTIEKDLKDGKSFLTDQPKTIIESGKFNKVPLLAGVNSAEGLLISGGMQNMKD
jgi:carboxylesterase type B